MPKRKSAPKAAASSTPAQQAVDEANKASDALSRPDLAQFQTYTCPDFTVQLEMYNVTSLPKDLHEWVFCLCKSNMESMYKKVWGWNNNKKRRQFSAPSSRFCIAFMDKEGQERTPVGYVNYRYELEGPAAVLYCYELQLVAGVRGRGLGPALMALLEGLAAAAGMARVMLTVMTENDAAMRMYRRLGYALDESSPGYGDDRDGSGYRIMSKGVAGVGSAMGAGGGGVVADVVQQRDVEV